MSLMLKYIKFRKVRFILAALGLGLLLGMVVAMGGIEGGMIRDATVFVDHPDGAHVPHAPAFETWGHRRGICRRLYPVRPGQLTGGAQNSVY